LALGLIVGRLRVYSIEADFWHELGLTETHSRVFLKYIDIVKGQWEILTWTGSVCIFATTVLLITIRHENRVAKNRKGHAEICQFK